LRREGDDSTFDAPEFNYRTVRGLRFDEGLKKAEEFLARGYKEILLLSKPPLPLLKPRRGVVDVAKKFSRPPRLF